jgi:hypothetical protein
MAPGLQARIERTNSTVISFMTKPVLLFLILAAGQAPVPQGPRPKFEDFPVKTVFRGNPAPPKLATNDQKMFRTMIRKGAKAKAEFAGHYTVPVWGCGSGCTDYVIADSISGTIYDGLFVTDLPGRWFEEHNLPLGERLEYHARSRLLKVNGCPDERDCGFYDYEMVDGKGLKLLRKELLPQKYQPQ